jgi:hypothetical protein
MQMALEVFVRDGFTALHYGQGQTHDSTTDGVCCIRFSAASLHQEQAVDSAPAAAARPHGQHRQTSNRTSSAPARPQNGRQLDMVVHGLRA